MVEKLRNALSGGKVYLICLGAIIAAVVAFINGEIDVIKLVESVIVAVGGMAMRAGIAKSAPTK
jgi:hypothetical protein